MEKSIESKVEKENKIRQILAEVELSRRQIEALTAQLRFAESKLLELNSALASLGALKEGAEGKEVLVSLGAGAFVRANLKEVKKIIVEIGADFSVEDDIDAAEMLLKERAEKMASTIKRLQDAVTQVSRRLEELDYVSQKMIQELQA